MASAPCCEFCCVAGHVCRSEAILRGDCPARKTGVSLWWRFGEAGRRSDQISSLAGQSFIFSHFSCRRATWETTAGRHFSSSSSQFDANIADYFTAEEAFRSSEMNTVRSLSMGSALPC